MNAHGRARHLIYPASLGLVGALGAILVLLFAVFNVTHVGAEMTTNYKTIIRSPATDPPTAAPMIVSAEDTSPGGTEVVSPIGVTVEAAVPKTAASAATVAASPEAPIMTADEAIQTVQEEVQARGYPEEVYAPENRFRCLQYGRSFANYGASWFRVALPSDYPESAWSAMRLSADTWLVFQRTRTSPNPSATPRIESVTQVWSVDAQTGEVYWPVAPVC